MLWAVLCGSWRCKHVKVDCALAICCYLVRTCTVGSFPGVYVKVMQVFLSVYRSWLQSGMWAMGAGAEVRDSAFRLDDLPLASMASRMSSASNRNRKGASSLSMVDCLLLQATNTAGGCNTAKLVAVWWDMLAVTEKELHISKVRNASQWVTCVLSSKTSFASRLLHGCQYWWLLTAGWSSCTRAGVVMQMIASYHSC